LILICIKETALGYEREPLISPFRFKGSNLTEIWQVAAMLESSSKKMGVGLGVQSVLWSDATVFSQYSESDSNRLMYNSTKFALDYIKGTSFSTPLDLIDGLLPAVYEFGKKTTCNSGLRLTFALNSLVAVDNGAWILYCAENGKTNFDDMIPPDYRNIFSHRNSSLGQIPLITYGSSIDEVVRLTNNGHFFLKIKIGSDPLKDGDQDKMLEWDKQRLSDIHDAVKDKRTPYTESGNILYYLDANGRYDSKDRLLNFLKYAEEIGALDRIILLEEPFDENNKVYVSDIPVRIAADESAHSDTDVCALIRRGYGAIALKPIAKTLSMTLKIAEAAYKNNIPCYCADLTVNPIMADWNKNLAARLKPLPGLKIAVFESNGDQNYINWEKMKSYHPYFGADWIEPKEGLFNLGEDFYEKSGGILGPVKHYKSLMEL
jgi:hypothetical protein